MKDIKASIRRYWDWRSRSFGYDKDKSMLTSMRFFCSYAGVKKWLPFYEGVHPQNAGALLQSAYFKNIGYYDGQHADEQQADTVSELKRERKVIILIPPIITTASMEAPGIPENHSSLLTVVRNHQLPVGQQNHQIFGFPMDSFCIRFALRPHFVCDSCVNLFPILGLEYQIDTAENLIIKMHKNREQRDAVHIQGQIPLALHEKDGRRTGFVNIFQ